MRSMHRLLGLFTASLLLGAAANAQDANFSRPIPELERLFAAEPLVITQAQISRPKAKGDITLRAQVSFGGSAPVEVKLRHADPGADSFNNVPRYDLAAYELQKLFLEPAEYVVPPTALRMVELAQFARYSPDVKRTFPGADQVLAVVQYWLSDIKVIADVYLPDRFATDPLYARHIEQLNVLTYLIDHRDSNVGNFLIGKQERAARVFSIDNGVAFASPDSDRGELWSVMRVTRLPADVVARLRKVTLATLQDKLGVLAQWQLKDGMFVPVALTESLSEARGVRRKGDQVQMGLTRSEIQSVQRLLVKLLADVDAGKITVVPVPTT
ncbi:MAG: hypothetical protein ABI616_07155 [Pseudomonadota bacterium]